MEAYNCSKGCGKYNKTIDEIAQAASKHREAALSLKTISETQKLKLSKYKARIDELELEVQQYETYASEVACKNIKLENTIKLLTKKLKSKTNDHNSSEEASEEESYLMNDKVKQLEEDVQIGFDMSERYRKETNKMTDTLRETRQTNEELNKINKEFMKKKDITDKIIKNLQKEKEENKQEIHATKLEVETKRAAFQEFREKKDYEFKELFDEVCVIQYKNGEKDALISKLKEEIEIINEKLEYLEKKNEDLETVHVEESPKKENKSLEEEIQELYPKYQNQTQECDTCNKSENKVAVEAHVTNVHEETKIISDLKLQEMELDRKISQQKFRLSSDLFKLKEQENKEKEKCNCKGYCRIFHFKHNYKKSYCQELLSRFDSLLKTILVNNVERTLETK